MLARRLPSILPTLSRSDAIEVTRIHSVAGLHAEGLITARPFRAPHHTISPSGLAGGGSPPRPGEATLAHHGVLFLDELSEFQRPALDSLRQPLEDGGVMIVRGQRSLLFPTRFMLVAATNPCPCGFAGVGDRCSCGEADLRRHRRRLSGPLLDRIDLLVDVRRPPRRTAGRPEDELGTGAGTRARGAPAPAPAPARQRRALQRRDGRSHARAPRAARRGRLGAARPRVRGGGAERPRTPPRRSGGPDDRRPRRARARAAVRRAARAEPAPAPDGERA